MLVVFHADARATEADAFEFEELPLLLGFFGRQADAAAGADYAVPGKHAAGRVEYLGDLAVVARVSGGGGDLTVGGDFTGGDFQDGAADVWGKH